MSPVSTARADCPNAVIVDADAVLGGQPRRDRVAQGHDDRVALPVVEAVEPGSRKSHAAVSGIAGIGGAGSASPVLSIRAPTASWTHGRPLPAWPGGGGVEQRGQHRLGEDCQNSGEGVGVRRSIAYASTWARS